jgi:type II secretory pathway pseudopilin PulG
MINIFNNFSVKVSRRLKEKDGMTLVEVIVAFLIIAIVSTVMVRGTVAGVNTMRINKSKTEALAIANEKIEIIKAIEYSTIIVTSEDDVDNPWMSYYPQLPEAEGEFTITYEVTKVYEDANAYKQLKVSVSGGYMIIPIDVVTQLYPPVGEEATIVNIYPPPNDLVIFSDEGEGESREIILNWEAPDTERVILKYYVYRNDLEFPVIVLFGFGEEYTDSPGTDDVYTYYIAAVYDGDVESVSSNQVTTGSPFVYPLPENFEITEYSGGIGEGRTVHLAWSAPDTELIITGYEVYRDGEQIDITTDLNFENIVGTTDFTYHIRILYEDENLSEPTNSVTTVYPMPPQNLVITGYSSNGKTVYFAWSAPDTEATVIEYQVYRDGGLIDSTSSLTYENYINKDDYTFYIKALYEIDNLSDPSNSVTTN